MIASRSRKGLSVLSVPTWASFAEGRFIVASQVTRNRRHIQEKNPRRSKFLGPDPTRIRNFGVRGAIHGPGNHWALLSVFLRSNAIVARFSFPARNHRTWVLSGLQSAILALLYD